MKPIPFRNLLRHEDDFMANDEIFIENDNLENEDGIINDENFQGDGNNSDNSRESENENYQSYMLFTPSLEDLKNVLYVALNPFFEEFEIEVVSCPCLTRAPFNLAAAGLSGNTGILQLGSFLNFCPSPRTNFAFNIYDILSRCNHDVFVIGSGFAAQPFMPSNGHLTMNAVVSTNPRNVINNSCIAYEAPDYLTLEIINDHNQIKCCIFGQFFFSEGKRGTVIKMRAKGRRSEYNILTLIQIALRNRFQNQPLIGLGIVLVINGGQTRQLLIPNDFVRYNYSELYRDYYNQLKFFISNCNNLIALGALNSEELIVFQETSDGSLFLRDVCCMFNTFFDSQSFGEFFNDVTPEETEYTVYCNIAQERFF